MSWMDRDCNKRLLSAPTLDIAGIAAAVIPLIPPNPFAGGQLVPNLTAFVSTQWHTNPLPPAPFFTNVLLAQTWLLTQGVTALTPGAIIIYPGVYGTVQPTFANGKTIVLEGEDAKEYGMARRHHLAAMAKSACGSAGKTGNRGKDLTVPLRRVGTGSADSTGKDGEFYFKGQRMGPNASTYPPFIVSPNVDIRAAVTGTVFLNYDISIVYLNDVSYNYNTLSDLIVFCDTFQVTFTKTASSPNNIPNVLRVDNTDISAFTGIVIEGGFTTSSAGPRSETHFRNSDVFCNTFGVTDGGLVTIANSDNFIAFSTGIASTGTNASDSLQVNLDGIVNCSVGSLNVSSSGAILIPTLTISDCNLQATAIAITATAVLEIYASRVSCGGPCTADLGSTLTFDGSAINLYDNSGNNGSLTASGTTFNINNTTLKGLDSIMVDQGSHAYWRNASISLPPNLSTVVPLNFDSFGTIPVTTANITNCALNMKAIYATGGALVSLSNTCLIPDVSLSAGNFSGINRSLFSNSTSFGDGIGSITYNLPYQISFDVPFDQNINPQDIIVTATITSFSPPGALQNNDTATIVVNQITYAGFYVTLTGPASRVITSVGINYQVTCNVPYYNPDPPATN